MKRSKAAFPYSWYVVREQGTPAFLYEICATPSVVFRFSFVFRRFLCVILSLVFRFVVLFSCLMFFWCMGFFSSLLRRWPVVLLVLTVVLRRGKAWPEGREQSTKALTEWCSSQDRERIMADVKVSLRRDRLFFIYFCFI